MSAYLESRAGLAKAVFLKIISWSAPRCGNIDGSAVKASIIGGSGKFLLKSLLADGVLKSPEDDALLDAIAYLDTVFDNSELRDAGHGVQERVFANVFDMLLAAMHVGGIDGGGSLIFRGHYDSRWRLVPSYYRADPRPADHLRYTILKGRIAYLQKIHQNIDFGCLSELQQEAVVQHYLSGTELVDFTTSMYVAAFFTTTRAESTPKAEMGAIYRISRRDITELMLATVESPELPPEFRRIHRQQGVFIRIQFHQAINDPGLFTGGHSTILKLRRNLSVMSFGYRAHGCCPRNSRETLRTRSSKISACRRPRTAAMPQRAAVLRSKAAAARDEFATDEQAPALWANHGS